MGDKFDLEKTMPMEAGDTGTALAGVHHFAMAKGAIIRLGSGVAMLNAGSRPVSSTDGNTPLESPVPSLYDVVSRAPYLTRPTDAQ